MWVQKSNLFSRELQLWTLVGLFVLVPTSSNVLCDLYTRIGVEEHQDRESLQVELSERPKFTHSYTHNTHAQTHTHCVVVCYSYCPPSFSSPSYSWAICPGKCCVRCVSNRTSSVPAARLLIVSSSAFHHSLARCALNHSLCGHLCLR